MSGCNGAGVFDLYLSIFVNPYRLSTLSIALHCAGVVIVVEGKRHVVVGEVLPQQQSFLVLLPCQAIAVIVVNVERLFPNNKGGVRAMAVHEIGAGNAKRTGEDGKIKGDREKKRETEKKEVNTTQHTHRTQTKHTAKFHAKRQKEDRKECMQAIICTV